MNKRSAEAMDSDNDSGEETLGESVGDEKEKEEASKPPKKRFRLAAKSLFLTYPKCDISPEEGLEIISEKLSPEEYIIAQEKHKVSGNTRKGYPQGNGMRVAPSAASQTPRVRHAPLITGSDVGRFEEEGDDETCFRTWWGAYGFP